MKPNTPTIKSSNTNIIPENICFKFLPPNCNFHKKVYKCIVIHIKMTFYSNLNKKRIDFSILFELFLNIPYTNTSVLFSTHCWTDAAT